MKMQKLKAFTFLIIFIIAALGLTTSPARAALLLVDGLGRLTGAKNVDVLGTPYEVTFDYDYCFVLFNRCDELADFDFTDVTTAEAAAQALLDQVFIDTASGYSIQIQNSLWVDAATNTA